MITDLVAQIVHALPDVPVHLAHVDVQEPALGDVVARVAAEGIAPVVVPLLLSTGFHVQVDIAEVVAAHPGTVAADPLGPDRRLVQALLVRLAEAGVRPDDVVVLAAAGSSRPEAATAVEQVRAGLAEHRDTPVIAGYCSAARPDVGTALQQARHLASGRVVIASYLLGDGFFQRRLHAAGADLVTDPLGAQPVIAEIAVDRARAAQR